MRLLKGKGTKKGLVSIEGRNTFHTPSNKSDAWVMVDSKEELTLNL